MGSQYTFSAHDVLYDKLLLAVAMYLDTEDYMAIDFSLLSDHICKAPLSAQGSLNSMRPSDAYMRH